MPSTEPANHSASQSAAVGPCGLRFERINYDQVGVEDGVQEGVELWVDSRFAGKTLSECGVTHLALYEGDTCERESESRVAVLSDVLVPTSGHILITRSGDSSTHDLASAYVPLEHGSWIENGPDFIALENQGVIVSVVGIVGAHSPSCVPNGFQGEIAWLPKDQETSGGAEHVLHWCKDGFHSALLSESPWLTEPTCAPENSAGSGGASGVSGAAGAPGASGTSGSSGASGSTAAGSSGASGSSGGAGLSGDDAGVGQAIWPSAPVVQITITDTTRPICSTK